MWCRECRQDVPGIASLGEGKFHCARCGADMGGASTVYDASHARDLADCGIELDGGKSPPADPEPPLPRDDWETEERLRRVEQLLRSGQYAQGRTAGDCVGRIGNPSYQARRIDAGHAALQPPHALPVASEAPQPAAPRTARARPSAFAWLALAIGLKTFVCGGVLLAWSFLAGRADLWSLGMPITLAGQCVLLFGLVLQLERLWQAGHENSDRLRQVDQRLLDLRQTTKLLGTTQGSASQSFYAHLSQGASPHILLADLKGQLDLLALRMSREER